MSREVIGDIQSRHPHIHTDRRFDKIDQLSWKLVKKGEGGG